MRSAVATKRVGLLLSCCLDLGAGSGTLEEAGNVSAGDALHGEHLVQVGQEVLLLGDVDDGLEVLVEEGLGDARGGRVDVLVGDGGQEGHVAGVGGVAGEQVVRLAKGLDMGEADAAGRVAALVGDVGGQGGDGHDGEEEELGSHC